MPAFVCTQSPCPLPQARESSDANRNVNRHKQASKVTVIKKNSAGANKCTKVKQTQDADLYCQDQQPEFSS